MNADLGVVTEEDEDAHLVDASGRVCEEVRRVQRRDPRGGSSCLEGVLFCWRATGLSQAKGLVRRLTLF